MPRRNSPPLRTWTRVDIGSVLQLENGTWLAHVWKGRDGLWRASTCSRKAEIHGPYGSESEARTAIAERV